LWLLYYFFIYIYIKILENLNGFNKCDVSKYPTYILKKIKKRSSDMTLYFTKDFVFKIQECKKKEKEIIHYNEIKRKLDETKNYDGAIIPKMYSKKDINTPFLNTNEVKNMIIYEKVGNMSLGDWLKKVKNHRNNVNIKKSKKFIIDKLTKFVSVIHDKNRTGYVTHNDLHTENVFISVDRNNICKIKKVYVIDFGMDYPRKFGYLHDNFMMIMLKYYYI